jgi:hypothetical protein
MVIGFSANPAGLPEISLGSQTPVTFKHKEHRAAMPRPLQAVITWSEWKLIHW